MDAQKIIQDFYHKLTMGLITVAFIIYLAFYEQFEGAWAFVKSLAPPIIFLVGMILVASWDSKTIKRRKNKNEDQEIIYLSYYDALINDLFAFGVAIIILFIPMVLFGKILDRIDVIQAIIAFLAIYWLRGYYFGKIGR